MTLMLICALLLSPVDVENLGTNCHAGIDTRCRALRAEEALRCRSEADAQCDIADAEHFVSQGDAEDAESRIDQACKKYEDLLNMMLPDIETGPLAETSIRYAGVSSSVFAILAREGEVEDLTRAVLRLQSSRRFLTELLERRAELEQNSDVRAALEELTLRLTSALDQLARRERSRGDSRLRGLGPSGRGDGGAMSYYRQAALHSEQAFALHQTFLYKAGELDAKLAQADLHAMLARDERAEAPRACESYRALRNEVAIAQQSVPDVQKPRHARLLKEYAVRAERGARVCNADTRIRAGAALIGIGMISGSTALGLFTQYKRACHFGVNEANGRRECLGIPLDGGETERYTAQVRASAGLAIGGALVFVAGAAILIPALVQRRYVRSRRILFGPSLGFRQTGLAVRLRF